MNPFTDVKSVFSPKNTIHVASILVLHLHIIWVYFPCRCYFLKKKRERFESDSRKVNFFCENRFPIPTTSTFSSHFFLLSLVHCHHTTASPFSLVARHLVAGLSWAELSSSYCLVYFFNVSLAYNNIPEIPTNCTSV